MSLVINGIEHTLDIVDPFGDGNGFVIYFTQKTSGTHISYPDTYVEEFSTYEKGKAAFKVILGKINEDISAFYDMPVDNKTGRDLLQAFIDKTAIVDGKLVLKD